MSASAFGKETTAEEVAAAFALGITGKTSMNEINPFRIRAVLTFQVLITGVNSNGLGAAVVTALAKHSPKLLILTARNPSKAASVMEDIKAKNPSMQNQYALITLDLSSLASVRAAAAEIRHLTTSIDIVVNNAGVMAIPERTLSIDGLEMHLATNFVGHFLLTKLLLPQLRAASTGARVVNITSAGYVLTGFRFSDYNFDGNKELPPDEQVAVQVAETMGFNGLGTQTGYVPMVAYAQANVANMLFTRRLCDLYGKHGLLSFSAAPGGRLRLLQSGEEWTLISLIVVVTDLQRHLPKDFRNPYMFYKTPSQGVASFLVAALDPALSGTVLLSLSMLYFTE